MKIELKDNTANICYYGKIGFFGIVSGNNEISLVSECREIFGNYWATRGYSERIVFKTPKNFNLDLAIKFWQNIFDKLGKESNFEIHTCNFNDVYVIDVPIFWRRNDTVAGFFSLFLRSSFMYFDGVNFDDTFDKYHLANKIKIAIYYFLNGYVETTYPCINLDSTSSSYGLVDFFATKSRKEVSKLLIKKPNIQEIFNFT